jgi:hypothetical protein
MALEQNFEQKLVDLLDTRNFHPELLDKNGRPTDVKNTKTLNFDYTSTSGKNYGTMVLVLGDDNELNIMYGDNLGKTMEDPEDRAEFFRFQEHLADLAVRNRWVITLLDISKLKKVQSGIAAIQEGLFEGYYGTKKVSYNGEPTQARLMIKHNRTLEETDARYRFVESVFIETVDGERFKLPFVSMTGARAMLEHVRQGGKPYDIRGCHIVEMVNELKLLNRFNRASSRKVFEGTSQEIIVEAQRHYQKLKESLKKIGGNRGYREYFESWHPIDDSPHEELVENIKTMFIEQTIDSRIEDALPLLARLHKNSEMVETKIFEEWTSQLSEGTWALPDTPESLNNLKQLMSQSLTVGPDALNATEQLYNLVGDDTLFDILKNIAKQNPDANIWDRPEVINRFTELGIDVPGQNNTDEVGAMNQSDVGKQENNLDEVSDIDRESHRIFKRRELEQELGHEDRPEFQDQLRSQELGPWYLKIRGKIYKQKGVPKSFDWRRGANNYALAIIRNRPDLKGQVFLTKNPKDDPMETPVTQSYYESAELSRIKKLANIAKD